MDDINKIRFVSVELTDTGKKIAFASFLKKDYVENSMVVYLEKNDIIGKIFFSSHVHGTVEWINGAGLKNCHRWESEDQAKSPTYLTARYTSILSDGAVDANYARETIIPDVLDNLYDADIAELVSDIVQVKEYLIPVDFTRFNARA
ncbi:MAG: hypothetical protein JW807_03385 [Spirochaetes bacterium]|nr:hypothetical protein [Spirochaetota bacterium]